jgi:hypothetical protein
MHARMNERRHPHPAARLCRPFCWEARDKPRQALTPKENPKALDRHSPRCLGPRVRVERWAAHPKWCTSCVCVGGGHTRGPAPRRNFWQFWQFLCLCGWRPHPQVQRLVVIPVAHARVHQLRHLQQLQQDAVVAWEAPRTQGSGSNPQITEKTLRNHLNKRNTLKALEPQTMVKP